MNMARDADILRELYQVGDDGISGAKLASRLAVSRTAIWARIEALRRVGFDIEASPQSGYRLNAAPDLLLSEDLVARRGKIRIIGDPIQVFQETRSTNALAERLGRDGVKEGAVVVAEFQTQGRGRLGRTWLGSNGKGVLLSTLLRPPLRPPEVTRLTVMGATAVVRAIRRCTPVEPSIKWPNDIMIGSKKVAGILTEMNAEPDRVRYVVLGIGLNVNQSACDWPEELQSVATSLKIETGQSVHRAALTAALVEELDRDYCRSVGQEFGLVLDEWQSLCGTIGKEVCVQFGERRIEGRAEAIDTDGALLVRGDGGHLQRVTGGDVSLRLND